MTAGGGERDVEGRGTDGDNADDTETPGRSVRVGIANGGVDEELRDESVASGSFADAEVGKMVV
jgi:hypothetical protein